MLVWTLAGAALCVLAILTPSLFVLSRIGVAHYAGNRDADPEPSPMHGRAQRAARNMLETFPIFALLAALAFALPDADRAAATTGAAIRVLSRAAFHLLYLGGVPWLRSAAWGVAFIGLLLMARALL